MAVAVPAPLQLIVAPRRKRARALWAGGRGSIPYKGPVSGWLVSRRQLSSAVYGGYAAFSNVPGGPLPVSGWLVSRRVSSAGVWGGYAAFSNVLPHVAVGGITADYDGKTWWKKRWILGV